ncbi:hypothetical protein GOV05_01730 [Candidatus Woesearchaeota archaeon]|nr:hypothetical protein [Candidatus Woesearchaeota archaeon]
MVQGHRIEKKISVTEFLESMKYYSRKDITCTKHTFFRLSENQRKLFKCDNIIDFLLTDKPTLVGLQYNQCYAVFYKDKTKNYLRIIIEIKPNKIEIVTFYVIDPSHLPQLK